MALPPRAKPLLQRLEQFIEMPAMAAFRAAATAAFLDDDRPALDEERPFADDYAMFEFKDARGRSMVDLFLAAEGAALPPDERAAIERMRTTCFGLFQVAAVRPGTGFRARRCGTKEEYEVVDVSASTQFKAKDCLLCRLVPYRDHHEISGSYCLAFDAGFAYAVDRAAARDPAAIRELSDPKIHFQALTLFQKSLPRPRNRIEAELIAGQVFAEIDYPESVEQVQARFQEIASPMALLSRQDMPPFESKEAVDRFISAIQGLWNFTPRKDLGGMSPEEKRAELEAKGCIELPDHLIHDLTQTVQREAPPEKYDTPSAARRALAAVTARWMQTPQDELGGLSPAEHIGRTPAACLPPDKDLPPRDRPVWTADSLKAKAAELAAEGRLHGLLWVMKKLERLGACDLGPIPGGVPDLGAAAPSRAPQMHAEARRACNAVESLIESLRSATRCDRDSLSLRGVLAALWRIDPPALARFLADRILHEAEHAQIRMLRAMLHIGAAGSTAPIRALCAATTSPEIAELALAILAADDTPEATSAAASRLVEVYADRGIGPEDAGACDLCFDFEILMPLEWTDAADNAFMLYHDPLPDHAASWRENFAFLLPQDDPAARDRAQALITEKRARQLVSLARRKKRTRLVAALAELVGEAATAACRTQPRFTALGGNLLALARALATHPRLEALTEEGTDEIVLLLASCLALAIRGRDMRAEIAAAEAGAVPWIELLAVDIPWMTDALFARMRGLVGEQDLLPLWQRSEGHVRDHAAFLLAWLDPARHAGKLLDADFINNDHYADIARAVVDSRGDAFLDAWCAELARVPRDAAVEHLFPFAAYAGTERGRRYVEHFLDEIFMHESFTPALNMFLDIADRSLALKVMEAVRQGRLDGSGFWTEYARAESLSALRTLIEVHGLDADAEKVLAEGAAAFRAREEAEDEHTAVPDDDGFVPPAVEPAAHLPPAHIPLETTHTQEPFVIRREEPKVGRNDPCPCGSGRKYKNCCG